MAPRTEAVDIAAAAELYVFLPDDIQKQLQEAGIELHTLLQREGLECSGHWGVGPAEEDKGKRSIVAILIGSAAVILSATPVLRRLIDAMASRPIIATVRRLQPVQDSSGNVVNSPEGSPLLYWVDENNLVPAEPAGLSEAEAMTIKGPLGLKLSYVSTTGGASPPPTLSDANKPKKDQQKRSKGPKSRKQ